MLTKIIKWLTIEALLIILVDRKHFRDKISLGIYRAEGGKSRAVKWREGKGDDEGMGGDGAGKTLSLIHI